MSKTAIRVMLVDDHAVVRSGLSAFLLVYDDLELVAQAADGAEALRLCERFQPDVILMDMMMPRMDGAATTHVIRERYPHIQVLILTSFKEEHLVQEALKAGAIGYLLKNVSADVLATAIRAAHQGRPTLAPEATLALIHAASQHGLPVLGDDLTERERNVLGLLVQGMDNHVIADTLIVSRSTVKFHVSNILSKLHAAGRTEAVAIALQHNLVPAQS
ncbi:MAG: response regulator transcription factor [Chloroflexi bacterium]|nr:response regulator transcription factor [Chloroflexota bacterium]